VNEKQRTETQNNKQNLDRGTLLVENRLLLQENKPEQASTNEVCPQSKETHKQEEKKVTISG